VPNSSEEAKFSTLRVTRPAIVTDQLIKFLKRIETVVIDLYGPDDSTLVYERETREQQLEPGKGRGKRGVHISDAQVYASNAIKLSLFERRAPVTSGLTRSFSRAKDYAINPVHQGPKEPGGAKSHKVRNPFFDELLKAAYRYEIEDPNELTVNGVGIVEALNPDYDHRGPEFGLIMDASDAETQYLNAEAGIVYQAIKRLKNSKRVMYPTSRSALYVPFVRLPYDADPRITAEFVGTIQDDYLPIELTLGAQDWGGNDPVVLDSI
jgi:hypothetical protein